jgi:hypothetical protein
MEQSRASNGKQWGCMRIFNRLNGIFNNREESPSGKRCKTIASDNNVADRDEMMNSARSRRLISCVLAPSDRTDHTAAP